MATYELSGTKYDLEKLHQTSREPLRTFIRLFSETRNSIPNISDSEAIVAFTKGLLYHEQLRVKLYRKRPTTIGELIQIANGYADAEEAEWATCSDRPQHRHDDCREERRYDDHDRHSDDREHQHDNRPKSSRGSQNRRQRPNNLVNAVTAPRAKCTYDAYYAKFLDGPCGRTA